MLVSRAEMLALENAVVAAGSTAQSLMESVGRAMARSLIREYRDPREIAALIYVGRGHNGGDALVVACALREAGARVTLRLAHPADKLAPLTSRMLARVPHEVPREFMNLDGAPAGPREHVDMVIDGLLGLNATGPLRPAERAACRELNNLRRSRVAARVVALDLPSGLDADTGEADADAVRADLTLSVGFAKRGLVADNATNLVGRLTVIRMPEFERAATKLSVGDSDHDRAADPASLAPLLPPREFNSHKGMFGRVGIFAGSEGFTGAAVLAALGALRGGAGLVTLFVRRAIHPIVAASAPPEAMVTPIDHPRELLEWKLDVLAIGPGLGRADAEEVCELVARFPGPAVVDADALNLVAAHPNRAALLDHDAGPRLLTPHPGEMARLFPFASDHSRAESALKFIEEHHHTTLLLKGARTIVAQSGQPLSYNTTGTPGMATGGMGDVLSGACAALISQGLDPYDAGRLGSWLCGRAAELAVSHESSGPALLPSDVVANLGGAFRELARRDAH